MSGNLAFEITAHALFGFHGVSMSSSRYCCPFPWRYVRNLDDVLLGRATASRQDDGFKNLDQI